MNTRLKEIRERHDSDDKYQSQRGYCMTIAQKDRGELLKMVDELETQLKAVTPYLKHSTPSNHCDYMKHSDNPCTCGLEAALKDKP